MAFGDVARPGGLATEGDRGRMARTGETGVPVSSARNLDETLFPRTATKNSPQRAGLYGGQNSARAASTLESGASITCGYLWVR